MLSAFLFALSNVVPSKTRSLSLFKSSVAFSLCVYCWNAQAKSQIIETPVIVWNLFVQLFYALSMSTFSSIQQVLSLPEACRHFCSYWLSHQYSLITTIVQNASTWGQFWQWSCSWKTKPFSSVFSQWKPWFTLSLLAKSVNSSNLSDAGNSSKGPLNLRGLGWLQTIADFIVMPVHSNLLAPLNKFLNPSK